MVRCTSWYDENERSNEIRAKHERTANLLCLDQSCGAAEYSRPKRTTVPLGAIVTTRLHGGKSGT